MLPKETKIVTSTGSQNSTYTRQAGGRLRSEPPKVLTYFQQGWIDEDEDVIFEPIQPKRQKKRGNKLTNLANSSSKTRNISRRRGASEPNVSRNRSRSRSCWDANRRQIKREPQDQGYEEQVQADMNLFRPDVTPQHLQQTVHPDLEEGDHYVPNALFDLDTMEQEFMHFYEPEPIRPDAPADDDEIVLLSLSSSGRNGNKNNYIRVKKEELDEDYKPYRSPITKQITVKSEDMDGDYPQHLHCPQLNQKNAQIAHHVPTMVPSNDNGLRSSQDQEIQIKPGDVQIERSLLKTVKQEPLTKDEYGRKFTQTPYCGAGNSDVLIIQPTAITPHCGSINQANMRPSQIPPAPQHRQQETVSHQVQQPRLEVHDGTQERGPTHRNGIHYQHPNFNPLLHRLHSGMFLPQLHFMAHMSYQNVANNFNILRRITANVHAIQNMHRARPLMHPSQMNPVNVHENLPMPNTQNLPGQPR